jgi:hypothetical protein
MLEPCRVLMGRWKLEMHLAFEISKRFLNLEKSIQTRTTRFRNMKNWAQTYTWKIKCFFFFCAKPKPNVLLKRKNKPIIVYINI